MPSPMIGDYVRPPASIGYGSDTLQISYRGAVADDASVVISHEHDGAQWVKASDMRVLLTDAVIEQIAQGDDRIVQLVRGVRTDLDRYLRRVARG
jgi:hypothetical protein